MLFIGFGQDYEKAQEVGICLFTLQGLELKHGKIKLQDMKTLISHTRPVEVYYDRFRTPTTLINYFKATNIQKHSLHIQPDHKFLVKSNFPELVDVSKETHIAVALLIIHLQKSL